MDGNLLHVGATTRSELGVGRAALGSSGGRAACSVYNAVVTSAILVRLWYVVRAGEMAGQRLESTPVQTVVLLGY